MNDAPSSFEVDKWEWLDLIASERGPPQPSTRLVLIVLGMHMTPKGERCFPPQEVIAARTGLSMRAVRENLKIAREGRWVRIDQRRRDGGRAWHVNRYTPTVPAELVEHLKAKPWTAPTSQRHPSSVTRIETRQNLPPVERDTRQLAPRHPAADAGRTGNWRRDTRRQMPQKSSSNSPINKSENVLRTPRAIEIAPEESPEEAHQKAEEEAKRLAEEQDQERTEKAKREADAAEQRRVNVLTALKSLPNYSPEDIAKVTRTSVAEVEQLRSHA